MIVVKVTYTVKEEYIDTNRQMIEKFLADFKKLDGSRFLYSVFQADDADTFVHLSQYKDQEIQQILLNTPSFLHFQVQRDENLVSKPRIEVLNYIGASREVL